jgi:hypothetical protein
MFISARVESKGEGATATKDKSFLIRLLTKTMTSSNNNAKDLTMGFDAYCEFTMVQEQYFC